MKLLMEPMVVAAILMKELPDKQVGSAESARMLLLHQKF